MPAILTHRLFGAEVYDELSSVIGEHGNAKSAFLLGNQGPDPLLCLKALPSAVQYRGIGTLMHTSRPSRLLEAMHRHLVVGEGGRANPVQRAYALGFLCHYLLDSIVHLLIFAQQGAIDRAGVRDLPPSRAGRIIHALIETELDEYLLDAKRGATVETFRPHHEVLRCGEQALWSISGGMAAVADDAYGLNVPGFAFVTGVHLYRAAQRAIDARREYPLIPDDLMQLTGDSYLHIQALTHSAAVRKRAEFANVDHVPWEHPFVAGEVVGESFDELYATAFERACATVPRYVKAGFDHAACEALTRGMNFYGAPSTEGG